MQFIKSAFWLGQNIELRRSKDYSAENQMELALGMSKSVVLLINTRQPVYYPCTLHRVQVTKIYQIKNFDAAESGKHPIKMKSIPKSVSGADQPYNKETALGVSILAQILRSCFVIA